MRHLQIVCWIGGVMLSACSTPTDAKNGVPSTLMSAGAAGSYTQIAAGFIHTCALDAQGVAYCWGSNEYSQLGSDLATATCGGRSCSSAPLEVAGGRRFTVLAAGWVHNCGIATDAGTYCWGGGATERKGYLGNGTLSRSARPVRVLADSAFAHVTIGDGHTCALTASGMAYCWGENALGQIGDGSVTDRPVPVRVGTPLRFRALSAGAYHTCGITMSNEAHCWGDNRWGQVGSGAVVYNSVQSAAKVPVPVAGGMSFTAVAAGWEHTCAIAATGATYCWGRNDDARQLGDDSDLTHRGTPGVIAGESRFTALTAGALATCGRTPTSETFCWGSNYYGGLGTGGSDPKGVGRPSLVSGGPYSHVALGQAHACALAPDRRLWCWGDQSAGQF